MTALTLERVTKTLGFHTILRDISLTVLPGELLVVTGANGAGKSTLLKVIAKLLPLSSGKITGVTQSEIGYLGHSSMVYSGLTVKENLTFYGELYGINCKERVPRVLSLIGLEQRQDMLAKNLSRGMMQRLSLGRILMQDPTVFLLDEPTNGLDESGKAWLISFLKQAIGDAKMLLYVTHNPCELSTLPFREIRLAKGRIL